MGLRSTESESVSFSQAKRKPKRNLKNGISESEKKVKTHWQFRRSCGSWPLNAQRGSTIRQVDLGCDRVYAEHLERMRGSVPVSVLFADYLQTKQRAKLSEKHLEDIKQCLGRFVADFADRSIKTVTIPEIADWLHGLDLSPQTVNNYRAVIAAFFGYAVRRELVEKNPVMAIEKTKVIDTALEIFTP